MSNSGRIRYFRPWNCVEGEKNVLESQEEKKVKIEKEEDDEDIESIGSSSSNCHSESDSTNRSWSVNSADINSNSSSLNLLNNFVLGKGNEHECYNSAPAAAEWTNTTSSSMYQPMAYHSANYQSNWSMVNTYLDGASGVLGADYRWLPANYQSVQEAVNRLNHQDAVAKHIKKLRPKKFRCHYCNVAFSNNGQLKGHLRIHTGERPFKCDAEGCGKSFTRNEELTRHKRIHTGLRPYSCAICRKNFGRKDHLKKHTKTHDNRNMYQLAAAAAMVSPFGGFSFTHQPTIHSSTLTYIYPTL